jgi:two-component system OmpR family response regulator
MNNTLRVMYADRDPDSREMLSILLGFENIKITAVDTAVEALRTAATQEFDLYLLATRFADLSGFELCRRLREQNPLTPIAFYSGDARDIDANNGRDAGADAYVVKPESERLITTIKNLTLDVPVPARPRLSHWPVILPEPATSDCTISTVMSHP